MKRTPKFEVYQDAIDEWRWRLRASNGKIIADGAESYKRKPKAIFQRVRDAFASAEEG